MKLTGKAKEAFLDYVFKTNNVLDTSNELYLNALIIEFFDSVGIYIEIGGIDYSGVLFWYNIQEHNTINGNNSFEFETRAEATNAAIIKANDLYNEMLNKC